MENTAQKTEVKLDATFKLDFKALLAVSHAMSTEKTRYYLCGIYVEPIVGGDTKYTATNGHLLIQTLGNSFNEDGNEQKPNFTPFIIPADAVKKVIKAVKSYKRQNVTVILNDLNGGKYSVTVQDDVIGFTAIDGTFPDVERVKPSGFAAIESIGVNGDYIGTLDQAARDFMGTKTAALKLRFTTPESPIEITLGTPGFYAVLMPMRV